MLIDNLYNSWDDNQINDYWLQNKIIDCCVIDKIYDIKNNIKSNNKLTSNLYSNLNNKLNSNLNNKLNSNLNNKLTSNLNSKTYNIKKLNNNNYTNKSIYHYGNNTKDKNIKR